MIGRGCLLKIKHVEESRQPINLNIDNRVELIENANAKSRRHS
jgi:hypothetical protein